MVDPLMDILIYVLVAITIAVLIVVICIIIKLKCLSKWCQKSSKYKINGIEGKYTGSKGKDKDNGDGSDVRRGSVNISLDGSQPMSRESSAGHKSQNTGTVGEISVDLSGDKRRNGSTDGRVSDQWSKCSSDYYLRPLFLSKESLQRKSSQDSEASRQTYTVSERLHKSCDNPRKSPKPLKPPKPPRNSLLAKDLTNDTTKWYALRPIDGQMNDGFSIDMLDTNDNSSHSSLETVIESKNSSKRRHDNQMDTIFVTNESKVSMRPKNPFRYEKTIDENRSQRRRSVGTKKDMNLTRNLLNELIDSTFDNLIQTIDELSD